MPKGCIELLVTFDQNYLPHFRTMLKSLLVNNPGETVRVWLLHSAIPPQALQGLQEYCSLLGVLFQPLQVDRAAFEAAPISKRYPQEMYYRLLAPRLLPEQLERVLYLDPDILVINPLRPLWQTELGEKTFAAASHAGLTDVMNDLNRVRLGTEQDYYNSGVVLMDLTRARALVKPEEIFDCVRQHETALLLPDQDVFNFLYGAHTQPVQDVLWNYDARNYHDYLLKSGGVYDLDWVIHNTSILHFCGRGKPWKPTYSRRFAALYKHYMQMAAREA